MADVLAQLEAVEGTNGLVETGSKLKAKQDLLGLLVANEQTRLMVWLFPIDYGKRHHFASGHHKNVLADVSFNEQSHDPKLTLLDCCNFSPQDGMGRESGDRNTLEQALPISATQH